MRYILIVAAITVFLSNNAFAQTVYHQPQDFPYNHKHHTINYHSSLIAGGYWLSLHLERRQANKIQHEIKWYYRNAYEDESNDAQKLHLFLQEKLKSILTVKQYEQYNDMVNYPELFWSGGAPVLTTKKQQIGSLISS